MPTEIHCPRCASANVVFSKKRGMNFCEDCGSELVVDDPIILLRIFLSYGHDSNEELVCRIKADLEKRGHDVWFDKNEIKFGDEWRHSITDGILKSKRVLSFLSKHSTRDPGVCRDEIAIAIGVKGGNIQTILVESEQEVQPPVNIGHILRFDMHDWKERFSGSEAVWKPSEISASTIGTELPYPQCGNPIKLNLFTINADWRQVAKVWNNSTSIEKKID